VTSPAEVIVERSQARGGAGHVLVLAHRFPPTGGAGVQRNLQLARHLADTGWSSTFITGPGPVDFRWLPTDEALSDDRLRTTVERLPATEPSVTSAWENRAERWLRVPLRWQRWWDTEALNLAARVGRDADVIHASIAPYSTGATAVKIARALRKPVVVDFEDPWALDEMLVYPTRLHRRLELRRMGRVLHAADAVVMNTPEARARVLRAFPRLSPERVHAVTNGYDPRDFTRPVPERTDGCFRIVHTGSMHTDLGLRQRAQSRAKRVLGGIVDGVDFLTRSHVYLLEAVAAVLRDRPDLEGQVEVLLAGVFTDQDRAVAVRYPFVTLSDFIPHAGTIDLMRSADLLFLPMHDLPAGRRAGLVPQKTYEYLASGRPILAAVPDGDARDLLQAAGTAALCRPADTDAMARLLLAEIERRRAGVAVAPVADEVLARCDAHRLVRELAGVFSSLTVSRA
jgi:glycosyltransferase involved in cell wall biosynthesis